MRAGNLRWPIQIQTASQPGDDFGSGGNPVWSEFAPMRAAIWPQKSVEIVIDGKLTLVTRFLIRTRWITGIDSAMRIKKTDDSRIFKVIGIKNMDERNRTIDFLCKEDV